MSGLPHLRSVAMVTALFLVSSGASIAASPPAAAADDDAATKASQHAVFGKAGVRQAYESRFNRLSISLKFDVNKIERIAPNWAYVITESLNEPNTVKSTGKGVIENNQEVFILKTEADGMWKAAVFTFNPISQPTPVP